MNWLLIVVLGIIVVNAWYGLKKGLIKTIFSFFSLLIAIGLTIWINPTVNGMMKANEKFYNGITEKVEQMLPLKMNNEDIENEENDNEKNDNKKVNKETVNNKKVNNETVKNKKVNNETVKKHKINKGKDNKDKVNQENEKIENDNTISDEKNQINYINELPLPKSLKDSLIKKSNDYVALEFNSFRSYISRYLAGIIINALAFIVTFIIINIILWTLCFALNIISKLPVLHQINKLAGLGAGLLQGLVIVWLFFIILTVLGGTKLGQDALRMISEDQILSLIYNNNILLGFITGSTKLFF